MSTLELQGVEKRFGGVRVLERLDLSVGSGEFLVLLGASGCGKTTALRIVSGLEEASAGRVLIDGRDVTRAAPAERGVSMVFQSYALFPHLSVAENIVFGLKVRRVAKAERDRRLARVAAMVGLDGLLDRKPAQLSGGQRQRVALARAAAAEHPLCLMDEPLSNLDAKLRQEMRAEIRALQRSLGMTVLYVTHDQVEAMSMADRVVLLRDGRIEQCGTPADLYDRPATAYVAQFVGVPPMNVLALEDGPRGAVIRGSEPGRAVVDGAGTGVLLGLRPEAVRLDPAGVPARVEGVDYHGADTVVSARIGDQRLLIRVSGRFEAPPGEEIAVSWPFEAVHLFEAESGRRAALPPKPAKGNPQCSVV